MGVLAEILLRTDASSASFVPAIIPAALVGVGQTPRQQHDLEMNSNAERIAPGATTESLREPQGVTQAPDAEAAANGCGDRDARGQPAHLVLSAGNERCND